MAPSSKDVPAVPLYRDIDNLPGLTWEGKVFGVSNPTVGTGILTQVSYAATLATFWFRNLGAKAMVPLYALLSQMGVVAGTVIVASVQTLEVDQFTSGTALTVKNRNQEVGDAPGVLAYHTATIPSLSTGNANQVFAREIFQTVTAANPDETFNVWPYPGFCVVRPGAAIGLYVNTTTTSGANLDFSISWAELEV